MARVQLAKNLPEPVLTVHITGPPPSANTRSKGHSVHLGRTEDLDGWSPTHTAALTLSLNIFQTINVPSWVRGLRVEVVAK